MPWKGEKDPYKIWFSEIILQQTRVEQGLKYYNDLLKPFPIYINWPKPRMKKYSNYGKDLVIIPAAET